MNIPVNFEIAKLLKEKKQNILTKLMYASNGKLTDAIYDFDDWCFAPTIAEVVMWLYEKHGIWVVVNIAIDDTWYFELYDLKSKRNAEIYVISNKTINFKTPMEAYEAAIKHILNNLI